MALRRQWLERLCQSDAEPHGDGALCRERARRLARSVALRTPARVKSRDAAAPHGAPAWLGTTSTLMSELRRKRASSVASTSGSSANLTGSANLPRTALLAQPLVSSPELGQGPPCGAARNTHARADTQGALGLTRLMLCARCHALRCGATDALPHHNTFRAACTLHRAAPTVLAWLVPHGSARMRSTAAARIA